MVYFVSSGARFLRESWLVLLAKPGVHSSLPLTHSSVGWSHHQRMLGHIICSPRMSPRLNQEQCSTWTSLQRRMVHFYCSQEHCSALHAVGTSHVEGTLRTCFFLCEMMKHLPHLGSHLPTISLDLHGTSILYAYNPVITSLDSHVSPWFTRVTSW